MIVFPKPGWRNEVNVLVMFDNKGIYLGFLLLFRKNLPLEFMLGVIPAAIALMTPSSCKSHYVCVRALSRLFLSARLAVTILAHAFGVVLSIYMDTTGYRELWSTFTPCFSDKWHNSSVISRLMFRRIL